MKKPETHTWVLVRVETEESFSLVVPTTTGRGDVLWQFAEALRAKGTWAPDLTSGALLEDIQEGNLLLLKPTNLS